MRAFPVAGAILLVAASPVRADPPARAAVVVCVTVNVSSDRAAAVARAFETALEEAVEVEVTVAAPDAADGPACATDAACLDRAAARLGVARLLYLVLSGAGDRVRVEFSRPVAGAVIHPPALILDPDPDARARAIRAAAGDLLPGVPARVAAASAAEPVAAPVVVAAPPTPPARDDGRARRVAGVASVAAGAVLAGASIYLAVRARSSADELEARFAGGGTWDDDARRLEDAHHAQRTWAAVLGVAGGVAVVAGGVLLAWGGAF